MTNLAEDVRTNHAEPLRGFRSKTRQPQPPEGPTWKPRRPGCRTATGSEVSARRWPLLTSLVLLAWTPSSFAGLPGVDLAISKTDGAGITTPGTTVTYTIIASNVGPSSAFGAEVMDVFPPVLTCTWTCAASEGSICTAAGTGDIDDTIDLLLDGKATFTAACDVDPAATGTLVNTATVFAEFDFNASNDSATDTNRLEARADLSVSLFVPPDPLSIGQQFAIDVAVDNSGPSDAADAVVTTTLPPTVRFDSTVGCFDDSGGVPTCDLGTLPAGQQANVSILVTAIAEGAEPIVIAASSSAADPNGADNGSVAPVVILPAAAPIPTIGQSGQIVLVLLLLGAAWWTMNRPRWRGTAM